MTNTFYAAGTTAWTLIASGATYARVGLQIAASTPVHIFIGTAAPAADTESYIILSPEGTRELDVPLLTADRVYARSPYAASIMVRGFQGSA